MEAVESFHGERISLPLKLLTYNEIARRHAVVDPALLPSVPESIYHPNLPILWIEGFDLVSRSRIWVPYESVHVNYCAAAAPGHGLLCVQHQRPGIGQPNSGGDQLRASARWSSATPTRSGCMPMRRRCRPAASISTRSMTSVAARSWKSIARRRWRSRSGTRRSDIGIPSFRCHIYEAEDNPNDAQGTFFGAGCHPARSIALLRALTEAAQSRLTYISGSRDDIERRDYRRPDDETPAERRRREGPAEPPSRRLDATVNQTPRR